VKDKLVVGLNLLAGYCILLPGSLLLRVCGGLHLYFATAIIWLPLLVTAFVSVLLSEIIITRSYHYPELPEDLPMRALEPWLSPCRYSLTQYYISSIRPLVPLWYYCTTVISPAHVTHSSHCLWYFSHCHSHQWPYCPPSRICYWL